MNTVASKPATTTTPPAETMAGSPHRVHETFSPGDVADQGDLTIVGVAALPKSAKPRGNRQLAEGDTQGSRHVLVGGKLYDADPAECSEAIKAATGCDVPAMYIGPVIEGPCTIEHPQHGHHTFPVGVVGVVKYQRNLDAEEREVRARD